MNKHLVKALYFKFISANKAAKLLGVKYGSNCIFRTKYFGTEPYLIEVGDNFETSLNVCFNYTCWWFKYFKKSIK